MFHHVRESSFIASSLDQHSKHCVLDEELCLNSSAFAQVVTALYEHGDYELLRAVFDKIEQSLKPASQNTRDFLAIETIETLQNVASWRGYDPTCLLSFLAEKRNASGWNWMLSGQHPSIRFSGLPNTGGRSIGVANDSVKSVCIFGHTQIRDLKTAPNKTLVGSVRTSHDVRADSLLLLLC